MDTNNRLPNVPRQHNNIPGQPAQVKSVWQTLMKPVIPPVRQSGRPSAQEIEPNLQVSRNLRHVANQHFKYQPQSYRKAQ